MSAEQQNNLKAPPRPGKPSTSPNSDVDVTQMGQLVGDEIERLESELAKAPFRVECEHWTDDDWGIGFARGSKDWELLYLQVDKTHIAPSGGYVRRKESLRYVSVAKKVVAIGLVPRLIVHMKNVHTQRVKEVELAKASIVQAYELLKELGKEGA